MAPYTSIPDLVPVPLLRPVVADRFDTLSKASSIAVPALVVRGGRNGDLFARDASRIYDAVTALAR